MNLDDQFDRIERGEFMAKVTIERNYITYGNALVDLITGGGAGHIGGVVNLIGDSGSGKTILATEVLYQSLKKFKDKCHPRYLDKESSYSFDTQRMYGFDMSSYFVNGVHSIEDFSADLGAFCRRIPNGHMGIYIVDSWDSLASDEELEEYEKRIDAHEKENDFEKKGSYGAGRAKYSSEFFRNVIKTLEESNVILIIISQIRDNLNAGPFGKKFYIAGGKALKFYSSQRLFLKTKEEYKKEDRLIGYTVELEAIKSRCRYPLRKVYLDMLTEFGVDDVGTNIDYLFDLRNDWGKLKDAAVINNIKWKDDSVEVNSNSLKEFIASNEKEEAMENWLQESGNNRKSQKNLLGFIKADPELSSIYVDHFGIIDRESLIQYIVQNNMEDEIAERAAKKWLEVEERIRPVRKTKGL